MLGTALFLVFGTICHLILIIVFPGDCENAEQKDREKNEGDEKTSLLGKKRSESILETYVRSRATTTNSYLLN